MTIAEWSLCVWQTSPSVRQLTVLCFCYLQWNSHIISTLNMDKIVITSNTSILSTFKNYATLLQRWNYPETLIMLWLVVGMWCVCVPGLSITSSDWLEMYHCIVRFYSLIQLTQNLPNDLSLGFYLGDIKSLRITKVISLLVWCGVWNENNEQCWSRDHWHHWPMTSVRTWATSVRGLPGNLRWLLLLICWWFCPVQILGWLE